MSRFGFSTAPAGGDFLPIVKYDARSGRFTRIDRTIQGEDYVSTPVDITDGFKAIFDMENIESGWLDFSSGTPSVVTVRVADLQAGRVSMPPAPNDMHKNGVRFLIKLAAPIAGEAAIREMASTAKAFVGAMEDLDEAYLAGIGANPGKLPVVVLDGPPIMQRSGSGNKTSTAYRPRFKIVNWVPRGDLAYTPRSTPAAKAASPSGSTAAAANGARPATGATAAPPPQAASAAQQGVDSDFG